MYNHFSQSQIVSYKFIKIKKPFVIPNDQGKTIYNSPININNAQKTGKINIINFEPKTPKSLPSFLHTANLLFTSWRKHSISIIATTKAFTG